MGSRAEQDATRAKKTLYVTGFDPRKTTKDLLEELFMQGGPVTDVKLFDTHAYVQFQDQDSVSYSLALFNDIELHGRKIRISPKSKSRESLSHLKYLMQVREILREQYSKMSPPKLPPKQMPAPNSSSSSKQSPLKRRAKSSDGKTKSKSARNLTPRSDSKASHRRRSRARQDSERFVNGSSSSKQHNSRSKSSGRRRRWIIISINERAGSYTQSIRQKLKIKKV